MDDLLKQIEGLIIEKSLSLDVIEIVRNIQSEHLQLTERNKKLIQDIELRDERFNKKDKELEDTLLKLDGVSKELTIYKSREDEFIKSENTIALKNKDVDSANRVSQEIKEIVGLVFKNTTIKKSMFSSEPIVQNGYSTGSSITKSENVEIKEE